MKTFLLRTAVLGFVFTLAACNSPEDDAVEVVETEPAIQSLTGTVTYVEDIILAPESVAKVELVDITDSRVTPAVVADTYVHARGRPPLKFKLEYDASLISPDRSYALRSDVMEQTRLMFKSTDSYPVFGTDQQGPVEILLKRVPGGEVERMADVVRAKNPTLSGFYYYFEGEGEFMDCEDESVHPVAREKGIHGLERGYRNEAKTSGDMVFTRVTGNYVTRPARSGGGKEDYLVVLQVEEMDATGDCP